jgi:4-carboxymuconolactone decarboxylase
VVSEGNRLEEGLRIRREVLGAERGNHPLADVSEFGLPLHELAVEFCWGAIWSRPGLSRQTRSIISVTLLSALNRQGELKIHVHGALRNGCSPDEIRETLMQVAVYCGVPAATVAMRTAEEALVEFGDTSDAKPTAS